jgi:hypothetical protein
VKTGGAGDAARDRLLLEPLVEELRALAALPVQDERRRLWADHQALRPVAQAPVSVTWEGIPGPQWDAILGASPACRGELARSIETDLRRRLWAAHNIPDDHVVWASVTVPAVESAAHGWGIPLAWAGSRAGVDDPLEARRILPAFTDRIDVGKVVFRDVEVDEPATRSRVDEAAESTGGRLAVHARWPDLGHSPFDIAARMCGIENLLVWCLEDPDAVAALMTVLTDGLLAHHRRRERESHLNYWRFGEFVEIALRVHCWQPTLHEGTAAANTSAAPAAHAPTLADEWAYVSAQTASGLGPDLYERLVQPSSERLAAPYVRRTVYYHGCECLDEKAPIIARIPTLRRFHVSPWSSVAKAVEIFADRVVLEVHAHPGKVFFGDSRADMRRSLERLMAEADGARVDLNLSDIHTVNGRPEALKAWAEEAREAGAGR